MRDVTGRPIFEYRFMEDSFMNTLKLQIKILITQKVIINLGVDTQLTLQRLNTGEQTGREFRICNILEASPVI